MHQQAEAFDDIIESTLNRHAPLRKTKIRPYFVKGLSKQTLSLIKKRNRLRIQSSRCKDPDLKKSLRRKYTKARNSVCARGDRKFNPASKPTAKLCKSRPFWCSKCDKKFQE